MKQNQFKSLIRLVKKKGRADSIQPGKPVFYTVFNHLVADPIFNASMEIETNMFLKKNAEADIAKLENTIEKLTNINQPNKPPKEIEPRIKYLLAKVVATEKAIEGYDAKIRQAKDAISKAWNVEEEKRI
jgi:hypothetical protein